MRDIPRWILTVLCVMVFIWIAGRNVYEAVTEEAYTALRIVRVALVIAIGVGCVIMNRK